MLIHVLFDLQDSFDLDMDFSKTKKKKKKKKDLDELVAEDDKEKIEDKENGKYFTNFVKTDIKLERIIVNSKG